MRNILTDGSIEDLAERIDAWTENFAPCDLGDPCMSARLAGWLFKIPITLIIDDVDPHGTFYSGGWRKPGADKWIEVTGRRDDPITTFTLWHEVAHSLDPGVQSTLPELHQEYVADRWACEFFERYIANLAPLARHDANMHLRMHCQRWYEANLPIHPVPREIGEWCGWVAPKGYYDRNEAMWACNGKDEEAITF